MKKHFVRPSIECCEFVVAARLEGSGESGGEGGAHSAGHGNNGGCSMTASCGSKACDGPSNPRSAGGNKTCLG